MKKLLTLALSLAWTVPALAGLTSPSSIEVDRSNMAAGQSGAACVRINSTTCVPIGSVTPQGAFNVLGASLPALGGDVVCPAGNPSACVVGKINGQTPAAVATSGRAADLLYVSPMPGSVAESVNDVLSHTIYLDAAAGAAMDGVTDDTAAANRVLTYAGPNTILQLVCNKSYYFAGVVQLAQASQTFRHCARVAVVIPDQGPLGFPGSSLTGPHISLGPNATINLNRGGGVEDAIIFASSITAMNNADTSAFAGTAITQGAGSLGASIHVNNVAVMGFSRCYDGSNGGSEINFQHVDCDAINPYVFGTSFGNTHIDDVGAGPTLTSGYPGSPITGLTGDGTTTKVSFTGPVIPVGSQINIVGTTASCSAACPALNSLPFVVTAATGSTAQNSASTASFAGPFLSASTLGQAQNYNTQYRRQGGTIAFRFIGQSDDTAVGRIADFGHDMSLSAESHGYLSVGHLWCDNNYTACIQNISHYGLSVTDLTAVNTGNIYKSSLSASGSSSPTAGLYALTRFGKVIGQATFGDAFLVNSGALMIDSLTLQDVGKVNGSGYAFNIGDPTAWVMVGQGIATGIKTGLVASTAPADHIAINPVTFKWADAPPGASMFAGSVAAIPALATAASIQPSVNINKTVLTGTATVSTIGGPWPGREQVFECTDACVFSNSGGVAGFGITPKGGAATITGPGAFRFLYSQTKQSWLQE